MYLGAYDGTVLLSDKTHPIRQAWGLFFGFVGLPVLVAIAWYQAPQFDPYSEIFFSRFYVEPSPEMPGEMRIAGWVFVGLGALLAIEPILVALFGRLKWRHVPLMLWLGAWVAAFGGAFFVAADTAEAAIERETRVETGQT